MWRRWFGRGRELPQRPADVGKGVVLPAAVERRLRKLLTCDLAGDETPQLVLTALGPEEGGAVERMSVVGFGEVQLEWMQRIVATMEGWVVDVVLTPLALELWFVQHTPRANGLTTHQGTALVASFQAQSRGADAARALALTQALEMGLRALGAMFLDQTRPSDESRAELRPGGELRVAAVSAVYYQPLARHGFSSGRFGARGGVLWATLWGPGSPTPPGRVAAPPGAAVAAARQGRKREADGEEEEDVEETESESGSDSEAEAEAPPAQGKRTRVAAS